jgi:RNA polymerase sigma factor (sigma-70 family)
LDETEIIRQCQKGKQAAQHKLFNVYADRFYRLALRYVKTEADAEDIVMMSFVKIFNSIKTFEIREIGSLDAWMRKIVVNEALMWLRKKHNFNLTESLDLENPEHDLESLHEIDAEYLYQLIVELPAGYRTVFNLNVIEGYDHREIGEMLQISESTSRSQLFKAKQILKRKIKNEGLYYGT